jgi:flagellar hook protein FlgE
MLGAIYIGLSGMNAYSKGLQAISNNVANLNSPGFKGSSVSFSDVFNYGGLGMSFFRGSDSQQAGSGVRFGNPRIDYTQGDLRQSDNDLDLAVQGNGFLVLLDGDKTVYARTGQFAVDEEGYITLQGTTLHLAVLDASNHPVALNIDTKRISVSKVTTKITFSNNLSWDSPSGAKVTDLAVYDSRGGKHVWTTEFAQVSGTIGDWTVTVKNENGTTVGTSTLKFGTDSKIDPTTTTFTATDTVSGADPISVVMDFSTGVMSRLEGSTSTISGKSDGHAVGSLVNVVVDPEGKVKLTYTNKETESLGAVALADFRDPQQLQRAGSGLFENTGNGQFQIRSSGSDGIGKLVSKQIEASNVDLSQEFGDLILIQRGFQASSQVVSVSNDMIQQLFGIRGQG